MPIKVIGAQGLARQALNKPRVAGKLASMMSRF